jgi:hypothetical protein
MVRFVHISFGISVKGREKKERSYLRNRIALSGLPGLFFSHSKRALLFKCREIKMFRKL